MSWLIGYIVILLNFLLFSIGKLLRKVVIWVSLMVGICRNCELSYNEATIERC